VQQEGKVYGVDTYNRPEGNEELSTLPQVDLIQSTIPPMPEEASDLDAIVIREFIWTYPMPMDGREDPETYVAIDGALKENGHLILHLNRCEKKDESEGYQQYQKTIQRNLPNFKKVYHEGDAMVYQKAA
jgi:hypothetical protein